MPASKDDNKDANGADLEINIYPIYLIDSPEHSHSSSFASRESVKRHIQTNGSLKLSATMKVVAGGSPLHSKVSPQFDDVFNGCYRQNDTRSYSICGDNSRLAMKEYCGNSSNFSKDIDRSKSLLREADYHIDLLNSARLNVHDSLPPKHSEALSTPDSYEDYTGSPQSNSPTRLLCPISFQPFIAFQGLYATTTCEIDNSITVEASQRSPTGLIAPPYIPVTSGNTDTEVIASEDAKSPNCHKIIDNQESGSIMLQSIKMPDDNNDCERNNTCGASFIFDKTQGVTTGCNSAVHSAVAGIESLSDQNYYNERGIMPLSSEVSDHKAASPLNTINDFDNKCLTFTWRDTSRADHTSNLLTPCGKGVAFDLLADSLHTVAQHSRSIETDHPLSMTSHGSHPSPKQINLTLPFKDVTSCGNRLYDTDCGTTAEFGDDGSSNIGKHGHHDNSFEMSMRSTLNTDAEISPMSPPSYFSYSDLYCHQNILPEVGAIMLPTIFEGRQKSDIAGRNLVTPYPQSQLERCSVEEVSSALESLGSRAKRSRRVLDAENNLGKYVLNEPIVYSKGKIIMGESRLRKGRLQCKPNVQAVGMANTSNLVNIKTRATSQWKLGKKSAHRFKSKKGNFKHPTQILLNLLIACAGVLISQLSMNRILMQVTPWVNLAFSVTMRSASVVAILALILVLDQRKRIG